MCADLASPEKLLREGGVDDNIRVAVRNGVPPVIAVQMATINVAEAFYLQRDMGAVAPGRYADILLVDDLVTFDIARVLVGGETVVHDGEFLADLAPIEYPGNFRGTVKIEREITPVALEPRTDAEGPVTVRVIGVTDGSLVTDDGRAVLDVNDGVIQPDLANDILPLTMADRFGKGGGASATASCAASASSAARLRRPSTPSARIWLRSARTRPTWRSP